MPSMRTPSLGRMLPPLTMPVALRKASHGSLLSNRPAAYIDDSPNPSVGIVTARRAEPWVTRAGETAQRARLCALCQPSPPIALALFPSPSPSLSPPSTRPAPNERNGRHRLRASRRLAFVRALAVALALSPYPLPFALSLALPPSLSPVHLPSSKRAERTA